MRMTISDAARSSGVPASTLWRWARRGVITAVTGPALRRTGARTVTYVDLSEVHEVDDARRRVIGRHMSALS